MSRTSFRRTTYLSFWILVVALAMGLLAAPVAHAVQASGSIQLVPSQQTDLIKDQVITVDVSFVNNSTTTPPPPGPVSPNIATLAGPITVNYACTDASCDCITKDPTRFSFVSCSIVGAPAGVVSCVDAGPGTGQVVINLKPLPAGLSLPASVTPIFLAKISLKANLDSLPVTRFRAGTDVCALSSCRSLNSGCATCAAEGCTFASGQTDVMTPLSCKHGCPNRISFFNGLDKLHWNALINAPTYDPVTDSFTLTLSNGGTVFTVTVPGVPQVGARTYEFHGPGNSTTPGVDYIRITQRTGIGQGGVDCSMGWWKVIVEGWGDMNAAQTKDPSIVSELVLGTTPASTFTNGEQWTSIPGGAVGSAIKAVELDFSVRSPC